MKFKISLSILFIVGLAVIFIISMCSLAGIAVNSVIGLGKNAANTTADSVYKGTAQLYFEHTLSMSSKYSLLFNEATIFAKLLADNTTASLKLYKFYNYPKNDYNIQKNIHTNPNGVVTNKKNPKFWYWGGSNKISSDIAKQINYLYHSKSMMKYFANYYPEFFGAFIINFDNDYLFEYYEDSFQKYDIKFPDKKAIKKYYSYILSTKNNWTKVYRDISGKFVMTTYFPFYNDKGKAVGRAGIDIDMSALIKSISSFNIAETNSINLKNEFKKKSNKANQKIFSFIIDSDDSRLISFHNRFKKMFGLPTTNNHDKLNYYHQTLLLKLDDSSLESVKKLSNKLLNRKEGYTKLTLNNNNSYIISFTRMHVTNWIFAAVISTDGMNENINNVKNQVNIAVQKLTLNFILISGTFILVAILVITLFFRNILLVPIKKLKTTVNRMRDGDYNISLKESGAKEIADLIVSFNFLGKELTNHTNELQNEVMERERVESEIFVAKKIQNSILPQINKLFNRSEFELYAELVPSQIVAGDFYDYFMLSKDKIAFLVADVSGKGISAAFYMTVAKSVIRDTCLQSQSDPAEVMTIVNKTLCEEYGIDMFISVFLIYYDLKTNTAKFSNAGHPNIIKIDTEGKIEEIGIMGEPVLGFMQAAQYHSNSREIKIDDTLILYTNGLLDANNQNGVFYGKNRFKKFIKKQERKSAHELSNNILDDVKKFADIKRFDDMTILVFIRKN
ncbi:MAG TPA: SpoIIE family protein phosphatase [Victivallales bacterium]|nr:SpoIIE family protein phosphatase [Victivallales bacterium]